MKGISINAEVIKTLIVLILVIVAGVLVYRTKGHDELDMTQFNIQIAIQEEQFSYEIADSEFNGVYRDDSTTTNSNKYLLIGKKPEGGFRMYFIRDVGIKSIVLRLDDVEIKDEDSVTFTNNDGNAMIATFSGSNERVIVKGAPGSMGDRGLKGTYKKDRNIKAFSLSEVKTR